MTDRLIVIAGVGPGIGLATARRYGAEGFTVALIARSEARLEEYENELQTAGIRTLSRVADCGDESALASALEDLQREAGTPAVLLYNAANLKWKNLLDETAAGLAADFRVNVAGALTAVRAVLPGMRAVNTGTLLLTGSTFATQPMPAFGSLSIGKAGLRNLAHGLAAALKDSGIRVVYLNIGGRVAAGDPVRSPEAVAELCWRLHAAPTADYGVEASL